MRAMGLVDELDSPRPGHLSDKPTALSAVTVPSTPLPLSERFVKAEEPVPNMEESKQMEGVVISNSQEEDQEVEDMVLDQTNSTSAN